MARGCLTPLTEAWLSGVLAQVVQGPEGPVAEGGDMIAIVGIGLAGVLVLAVAAALGYRRMRQHAAARALVIGTAEAGRRWSPGTPPGPAPGYS